jgi:hypothetical protein
MEIRTSTRMIAALVACFLMANPGFCQSGAPDKVEIKIRKVTSTSFSELVKRITLLPIGYRSDAIIQKIDKIQIAGDKFYLLNKLKTFIHRG